MTELAINGGKPVRDKLLPYTQHWVGYEELDSIAEVVRSKWLTQGEKVDEFEKIFADYIKSKHAISVSSCTAGLHLCAIAMLKPDDEVITTPLTFVATPNSIFYVNAKPVFADIDMETMNITPETIEKVITDKTKAIMPVHYGGLPCNMDGIIKLAKKHNLIVIDDAAHAVGAESKNRKIGSIGNATCFSFHPAKQMTTGEGGMITTNDNELAKKLKLLRGHGINKDFKDRIESKSYHYEMELLGYNYRLNDIQAAMGISQLKKLDEFIKRRTEIANQYEKAFKDMSIKLPKPNPDEKHAWHFYTIQLELEKLTVDRDTIFQALRAENIGVNILYIPVYKQPFYKNLGYTELENTEKVFERIITLPLFPKMTDKDIEDTIEAVKKVLEYYKR